MSHFYSCFDWYHIYNGVNKKKIQRKREKNHTHTQITWYKLLSCQLYGGLSVFKNYWHLPFFDKKFCSPDSSNVDDVNEYRLTLTLAQLHAMTFHLYIFYKVNEHMSSLGELDLELSLCFVFNYRKVIRCLEI